MKHLRTHLRFFLTRSKSSGVYVTSYTFGVYRNCTLREPCPLMVINSSRPDTKSKSLVSYIKRCEHTIRKLYIFILWTNVILWNVIVILEVTLPLLEILSTIIAHAIPCNTHHINIMHYFIIINLRLMFNLSERATSGSTIS